MLIFQNSALMTIVSALPDLQSPNQVGMGRQILYRASNDLIKVSLRCLSVSFPEVELQ